MRFDIRCIRTVAPTVLFWFACSLLASLLSAQTLNEKLIAEVPGALAKQARSKGNIVRGAILFHQGNINCAKCHRPASEKDRLGPDLSRIDQDVTDEYIIESILQPSKQIKKGFETLTLLTVDGRTLSGLKIEENDKSITLRDRANVDKLIKISRSDIDDIRPGKKSIMPDGLVDELKDRQQFLDLLRYVFDVKQRGPDANAAQASNSVRRELSPELQGLVLVQKLNCTACHQSESLQSPVAVKKAPRLEWSAVNLNPSYIEAFIANPHAVKPGSTMPELLGALDEQERKKTATAITNYLLSKSKNKFELQPIDGEAMHRGFALFNSVGCVACHSPRNDSAEELPLDGSFPLGDLAGKYSIDGLSEFLEDPLAVRTSGHMPDMNLTHKEAVDLSNFLLQSQPSPESFVKWKPDPELAVEGETLFTQSNCASCHAGFVNDAQVASGLNFGKQNLEKGCLSNQIGQWPNFHFSDQDSELIQAALRTKPTALDEVQQIEVTLTAYNCIACHDRGDLGGVTDDRNPHFQTTNLNLGDQGRIPPTLTGVGAKLNPKWMRDVLVNHRSIRPYMKTRMPQYGEENVGRLVKLFGSNDRLAETKFAEFDDQKAMREKGHVLAGHKGLNCVACHTYQYKVSDTMPAVDLTEMTERLKKDWFYQYMLAPQTFSPNTVMPSFWPSGQAIRADIEGTPNDQIEALWQYLVDGRQARAPSGVVREPLEIIVTNEARMLRRSYKGIGKRGIGVGYPGDVNIAFDAEQMRLGSIWRGKFAEASGVWRGQGSGTVRPMSRPVDFAKGPELDDTKEPWPVDDGRPPNHQFKGYSLDREQRPTFRYVFESVDVEDFFSQVTESVGGKTQIRRSVTMSSAGQRNDLKFRIAEAAEIGEADGVFVVGNDLKIRIVSQHAARIVDVGDQKQLEVLLAIGPGEKQALVIEYLLE